MTDNLIEDLKEAKEQLHEEGQTLNERAQALEWETIANVLRKRGESEKSIALEKKLFDLMQRQCKFLAGEE